MVTNEERNAFWMLLGPGWTYGHLSHTFIKTAPPVQKGVPPPVIEARCADTLEVLSSAELFERRLNGMKKDKGVT